MGSFYPLKDLTPDRSTFPRRTWVFSHQKPGRGRRSSQWTKGRGEAQTDKIAYGVFEKMDDVVDTEHGNAGTNYERIAFITGQWGDRFPLTRDERETAGGPLWLLV